MNKDKKTGILLGVTAVLLVIVVGLGVFLIGMNLGQKKASQGRHWRRRIRLFRKKLWRQPENPQRHPLKSRRPRLLRRVRRPRRRQQRRPSQARCLPTVIVLTQGFRNGRARARSFYRGITLPCMSIQKTTIMV